MNKHFPLYLLLGLFVGALAFSSCNDDKGEDSPLDTSDEFAVMVNTFSLKSNDSILANLDSVFFSIDLNNARVFNADSLPLGTRVDSLGVSMTFSAVSKAEITMPGAAGKDTVVDYLSDSNVAIDFSRGYVTLHMESSNEMTKRDYRIFVNVHKMKPDSLAWGNAQWTSYPTTIKAPVALKAVELDGNALCFATDGQSLTRAMTENPALNSWRTVSTALPDGVDVNTITAGGDALYAIGSGGVLFKSEDMGDTWTGLGVKFHHIYGVYGTTVLGVEKNDAGEYNYVTYPASVSTAVPAGAPVAGTSQAVTFESEWSAGPMMMVQGGVTASGDVTGSTWAYDGTSWTDISIAPSVAAKDMTMVPYFTYKVGANWAATKRSALIAFGGIMSDGRFNRQVYVSVDRGMHWSLAGPLMQLPDAVPTLAGAQALVFEQTLPSRGMSVKGWKAVELPVIPSWFTVNGYTTGVKPIESWECPYIYLFGGRDAFGQLNSEIWRGVINRLSFKPLQ